MQTLRVALYDIHCFFRNRLRKQSDGREIVGGGEGWREGEGMKREETKKNGGNRIKSVGAFEFRV